MFSSRFLALQEALSSLKYSTPEGPVDEAAAFSLAAQTLFSGGTIYVIGNGASAAIASHFSSDLLKCLQIPSQTLYDASLMTCLANDLGFEQVFNYPLGRLLRPYDALVAISSSGKSPNIVKAAETALQRGAGLITLTGFSATNPLRQLGHLNFWVGFADYGLVETVHFSLLRALIDLCGQERVFATSVAAKNKANDPAPIL